MNLMNLSPEMIQISHNFNCETISVKKTLSSCKDNLNVEPIYETPNQFKKIGSFINRKHQEICSNLHKKEYSNNNNDQNDTLSTKSHNDLSEICSNSKIENFIFKNKDFNIKINCHCLVRLKNGSVKAIEKLETNDFYELDNATLKISNECKNRNKIKKKKKKYLSENIISFDMLNNFEDNYKLNQLKFNNNKNKYHIKEQDATIYDMLCKKDKMTSENILDLKLEKSKIVHMRENHENGNVLIGFSVGKNQIQVTLEATAEQPFFVVNRGWSSCSPKLSLQIFALSCSYLSIGDTCFSLIHTNNLIGEYPIYKFNDLSHCQNIEKTILNANLKSSKNSIQAFNKFQMLKNKKNRKRRWSE